MPAQYRLRRCAKRDLAEIVDYLSPRSEAAAKRFLQAVEHDFNFLAKHPRAGGIRLSGAGSLWALRTWPVSHFRNYLIFYLPRNREIEIVRILHGARNVDVILADD